MNASRSPLLGRPMPLRAMGLSNRRFSFKETTFVGVSMTAISVGVIAGQSELVAQLRFADDPTVAVVARVNIGVLQPDVHHLLCSAYPLSSASLGCCRAFGHDLSPGRR
ncbi:hypothetical protein, partial [Cryobacterium sp. 5B3]|uniref:hypothetical protein n=1 Tax=Cryobacterium sp. 5B3 TaxID=3048586 RepID=UPI002B236D00